MEPKPVKSDFDIELGQRLKRLRQIKGLSQRELAKRSGVTHSNISIIEQGNISPSVQSLARILQPLGLNLIDFFGCANRSLSSSVPAPHLSNSDSSSSSSPEITSVQIRLFEMSGCDEAQLFTSGESTWLAVMLEGTGALLDDTGDLAMASGAYRVIPPWHCVGLTATADAAARVLVVNCG